MTTSDFPHSQHDDRGKANGDNDSRGLFKMYAKEDEDQVIRSYVADNIEKL